MKREPFLACAATGRVATIDFVISQTPLARLPPRLFLKRATMRRFGFRRLRAVPPLCRPWPAYHANTTKADRAIGQGAIERVERRRLAFTRRITRMPLRML